MLRGRNIVCVSTIDWSFLWQEHQGVMSVLARAGNRILFVENTGVRSPGWKDRGRVVACRRFETSRRSCCQRRMGPDRSFDAELHGLPRSTV